MNRWGVREHFVYWLFDADGECLYVGMTRQPEQRWKSHCANKRQMVAEVAYKRMAGPFLLEDARRLEREQQEDLQPTYDMVQGRMRARAFRLSPNATTAWNGGLPQDAADALRRAQTTWGIS